MKRRKKNPRVTGGERLEFLKKGVELYRDFSGHVGEYEMHKLKLPKWPTELVAIGECDFIGYTTIRDGEVEKYKHDFRKSSRPLLCTTPDGKQLFLVGGVFQFTDRGIVDK